MLMFTGDGGARDGRRRKRQGELLDLGVAQAALLDGSGVDVAEAVLNSVRILTGSDMQKLMSRPEGGGTKSAERRMANGWAWYEAFCKGHDVDISVWPPSWSVWQAFMTNLRAFVSSRDAFHTVYNSVCTYGSRKYGGTKVHKAFGSAPKRLLCILHRHYGSDVRQVVYINATEARNFQKFVDRDCMVGMVGAASFAFGLTGGGKRARTVTGIRLRDVEVNVEEAFVGGKRVLVPAFQVTLVDEKFSDAMGARSVREWLTGVEGYDLWAERTYSWWLYRLLVVREAFDIYDPMKNGGVQVGDGLRFKKGTSNWFLFCFVRGDLVVNTRPLSMNMLNTMTSKLLMRMGSEPRGYSAHRKGCVTRAMERELLVGGDGQGLNENLKAVLVRWGGWDVVRGDVTVAQRYGQNILDRFMDCLGLGLGKEMTATEREAKMRECVGEDLEGDIVHEVGSKAGGLTYKMIAYSTPAFREAQAAVDAAAKAVIALGMTDDEVL